MEPQFCDGCGAACTECAGCLPELDPPRYCAVCGTWLAVRVSPTGYRSTCRTCAAARR